MKTIYLAAPLFSIAEQEFNQRLCDFLTKNGFTVFLPQKECANKDLPAIFATCKSGIDQSAVVLAVLDGADADSGTCWECGYAYAKEKPVVALRTDFRQTGDTHGFNAMLYFCASAHVETAVDFQQAVLGTLNHIFSKIA
jgi:nucleoside 2-deoxyribosyltransferase